MLRTKVMLKFEIKYCNETYLRECTWYLNLNAAIVQFLWHFVNTDCATESGKLICEWICYCFLVQKWIQKPFCYIHMIMSINKHGLSQVFCEQDTDILFPRPTPHPPPPTLTNIHITFKWKSSWMSKVILVYFGFCFTSFCDRLAITNYDCFFTCSEATRPKSPMSGFQLTWTLVICEVFCHFKPQPTSLTFSLLVWFMWIL